MLLVLPRASLNHLAFRIALCLIASCKCAAGCVATPTDEDDCGTCASVESTANCVTDGFSAFNCFGFASETPVTPPDGACSAIEVTCADPALILHVILDDTFDRMFAGDSTQIFYCYPDGTTQLDDASVIAYSYCATDCGPTGGTC